LQIGKEHLTQPCFNGDLNEITGLKDGEAIVHVDEALSSHRHSQFGVERIEDFRGDVFMTNSRSKIIDLAFE
jgi:hypothetical protein